MKKLKLYLSSLLILTLILVGCNKNDLKKDKNISDKKIIYTTFFPVYDLTKRIVGDKMEVKTIISANDEPHSFEFKTEDMKNINESDLIIYNGAGIESFINDLKNSLNNDDVFLDLSQGLTLLESKSDLDTANHASVNPHTWLSIKNAMEEMDTIYKKISSIDPNNDMYPLYWIPQ